MKPVDQSGDRIQLSANDSVREIQQLVSDIRVKVLQFSEPLPERLFSALNEEFFCRRPDVALRAYGFYGTSCDLSFCTRMTHVERFHANCLHSAVGVEHIAHMRRLTLLDIGIWSLSSFEFLNDVTEGLTEIGLSQTKSKKPDLAPLARFQNLRKIGLFGQQKNIDVLAGHPNLEEFWCSVSLADAELFKSLPKLWWLNFILGGTRNLEALRGLENLKFLEICRVSRLDDVSFISSLIGLQHLVLQDLPHIEALPDLSRLCQLRRVDLENMRGLMNISSLAKAPKLEQFVNIAARNEPEDYLPALRQESVKFARAGFGSNKKNKRFEQLCVENGVAYAFNHAFKIT